MGVGSDELVNQTTVKRISKALVLTLGEARFLELKYRRNTGHPLRLRNPERFSEKLQWLKLNHRVPLMNRMSDKIAVKSYVAEKIGEQYVIPLVRVFEKPDDLGKEPLPGYPVVLKTNHDSGGVKILYSEEEWRSPDLIPSYRQKLKSFYYYQLEWEYKNITPKVFAEEHIRFEEGKNLLQDFKIHCFHGIPRLIQTITDRESEVKENWFDTDWNEQDMYYFSAKKASVSRPSNLDILLELAEELAGEMPYVRVDFYTNGQKVLFGEFTFRPFGGFMVWNRDDVDYELGRMIRLQDVRGVSAG